LGALRAFAPRLLFADGSDGAFFDARSGACTDVGGTTPALPGQAVAFLRDLSGNGRHATQATVAARPTYGRHPANGIRNRLPNTSSSGAAVGTLDGLGALPTGWTITGIAASGVEVLSIADKAGRPNIRLRFSGTPTTAVSLIFTGAPAAPAASDGQSWTASAYVQRVGGDETNITSALFQLNNFTASDVLVDSDTGGSFLSTIGEDLRRAYSVALTGATIAKTRSRFQLGWTSGAIDITLDIGGVQLEQAAEVSALQVASANGFDITEAWQRSIYYLSADGVDDFMTLGSSAALTYPYTLGAAHNINDSSTFSSTTGTIFGSTGGDDGRFGRGSITRISLQTDASNTRSAVTASVPGRVADIARLVTGDEGFWRNGVKSTSLAAEDGTPEPTFTTLFRIGASYAAGLFYAGMMIDRAITDAERLRLQLHYASAGGIVL
jgi:hypothetical protein